MLQSKFGYLLVYYTTILLKWPMVIYYYYKIALNNEFQSFISAIFLFSTQNCKDNDSLFGIWLKERFEFTTIESSTSLSQYCRQKDVTDPSDYSNDI